VLIHGRLDLSCPVDAAWELARAWPDAELVILNDSGHKASDTKRKCILGALDKFARHQAATTASHDHGQRQTWARACGSPSTWMPTTGHLPRSVERPKEDRVFAGGVQS